MLADFYLRKRVNQNTHLGSENVRMCARNVMNEHCNISIVLIIKFLYNVMRYAFSKKNESA